MDIVQVSVGSRTFDEDRITREEANLFAWTANSPAAVGEQARHGRQRNDPPPNPMSEEDALTLIQGLIRQWLDSTAADEP
jgi:hypothetical protein